ncbi:DUF4083 family protein [Paenibacillus macquariensis]|uniref:DUF4083 domain-containing protein n=1 Tax=Paenibacillus macquariensis TaxID=948756 RepID=A0ABY1K4P1_9BACL|nr:DUF4083 family protein [Paenibacillus macquariensis]MEC0089046.1 DUF4083 family protein [Paenibacillus macquariensis]OAB31825.1 hypothetical protein PMSM_18460 [Paenibacillus macquariensis subsp. macquariensis]SIR25046.1 protein of unknown function [Paenibacillus macquariensis]
MMFNGVGLPGLFLLVVVVGLIILFFVSLYRFIRKLLTNSAQTKRSQMASEARLRHIEDQLDVITKKMDKGN